MCKATFSCVFKRPLYALGKCAFGKGIGILFFHRSDPLSGPSKLDVENAYRKHNLFSSSSAQLGEEEPSPLFFTPFRNPPIPRIF